MIQLYLGALAFGGTLLVASLVLGGEQHGHGGAHGDGDGDHDGGLNLLAWMPVTSLRFWTFLFAFGGGVGAAATWWGGMGTTATALLAGGLGWLAGTGAVMTLRSLGKGSVGSEVSSSELAGETAEVVLGLGKGELGKVRVSAKGRVCDFVAETDDEAPLPTGSKVMVVGPGDDGRLIVTRVVADSGD